jgi:hypothetical protein
MLSAIGSGTHRTSLTVSGKSHPRPFFTWATSENVEGFCGCRPPHPAAADFIHSQLSKMSQKQAAGAGFCPSLSNTLLAGYRNAFASRQFSATPLSGAVLA